MIREQPALLPVVRMGSLVMAEDTPKSCSSSPAALLVAAVMLAVAAVALAFGKAVVSGWQDGERRVQHEQQR